MCIAVFNPKGVTLDKDTLARCYLNNPDGIGLAYHYNGEVFIEKYPKPDFSQFYERYHELKQKYSKSNFLLHFRVCNSGYVDDQNTHPHIVNDNLVFCHNGTISDYNNGDKTTSDSIKFNNGFLKKLPPEFERYPKIRQMLDKQVGTNKLIFLNGYGEVYIINEDNVQAEWDLGCWFSNDSYSNYSKLKSREKDTQSKFIDLVDHRHYDNHGRLNNGHEGNPKKKEKVTPKEFDHSEVQKMIREGVLI